MLTLGLLILVENLYEFLSLELESSLNLERSKYFGILYHIGYVFYLYGSFLAYILYKIMVIKTA